MRAQLAAVTLISLGAALGITCRHATAATFVVDSTADEVDASPGDGVCQTASMTCTLRAAVQEANHLAGADTIQLPAGAYVLTIPPAADGDAANGDLEVLEDLTVTGAGAATTILDGNGAAKIFTGYGGVSLVVSGVTIRNGVGGVGGGLSADVLTLTDAVVAGNRANVAGGIYAPMGHILRTTVRDNHADLFAGGLGIIADEVRASTFTGNVAGSSTAGGDAILASGGSTVTVVNSTVQGQIGTFGFCNPPPFVTCTPADDLVLNNVTVTEIDNIAYGPPPGTVTIRNSIVFGCSGSSMVSAGYNDFVGSCGQGGDQAGNLFGVDPALGPLQDNGGPTATRMPLAGSLAVNAANPAVPGSGGNACEAADQRGVGRPIGGRCDMGAVETSCGDGVHDPGEECDDGNATSGDGCDANCRITGCGNGIVTAGEQCDDGNTVGGDCCDAACQLEAPGTACTSDGNVCTDDVCSATGKCLHQSNSAPCDDGDPCTTGDTCAGGFCRSGTGCAACLACNPGVGCEPPPPTCAAAAPHGAALRLKHTATATHDRLTFSWKSLQPVDAADFGDPLTTDSRRVCIYDGTGLVVHAEVPPGQTCPDGPCWKRKGAGFAYRDGDGAPDGIVAMRLFAGSPGKIRATGKGPHLHLGTLPLVPPVRLRVEEGSAPGALPCFDATFDAGITADTATSFRGRSN